MLYSFADNHDVDRIISKLNDKRHLKPVYTLLYTLPGVPSIYYGSEWGIDGRKANGGDPALRPRLVLEEMQKNPPVSWLPDYLEFLGKCREKYPVIGTGRYRELLLTNRQYAFARIKGDEAVITAVNNDDKEAYMSVPLPIQAGILTNLETGEKLSAGDGRINLKLEAGGSALIHVQGRT